VPALVSDASLLPDGDDPFAALASMLDAERIARLRAILRMDLAAARIALAVERELEPDLLMVYLPGIDRTSHLLWGALEPEFPFPRPLRFEGAARAAAAEAVRDYYRLTDAIIGRLLEGFGADDLVIVVSDHGFEAHAMLEHHITGGHDSPASENGVVFARGPGVRAGSAAGDVSVNDVTPTILAWLGLPVGADMDGRPAGFLAGDPPAVVASWDRGPIERVVAPAASEIEEEVIDQLRSFGYVEE
jgi:predicted AlkP superfamily phosphohydrolase/phosphomutase